MANSIIRFLLFELFFLFIRARSGFSLANSGFTFEGTTAVFRCGIATERIAVFRCSTATEGITDFRCSISTERSTVFRCGIATGGIAVFRCDIATGGITVFRSRMLLLIARRRRDCLKLMLSAVCCDKFLTLWDLVSSIFEVSF